MDRSILLELREISKRYSGLLALDGVSFSVDAGTITALIGPNGAGKSTAFNLVSGLDAPTAGRIRFAGEDVTALDVPARAARGLARIFQTPRVFEYLSVLENVMVGLHGRTRCGVLRCGFRLRGFHAEERGIEEEALAQLRFVGLGDLRDRMAGTLSFGNLRLLEFARALAAAPKLIMLDEPTAGLTPAETEAFGEGLRAIRQRGVTVLIVEHDLKFITSIAEKVIVLNYGRKIYDGAPGTLRDDRNVIEAYIGVRRERRQHA
jgi:branched-chain amino acid transport system ATP-binding protein